MKTRPSVFLMSLLGVVAFATATSSQGAFAQQVATTTSAIGRQPVLGPAIDGIFKGFETHPLVAIADIHGMAQQQDFYAALIRDPRFAREVRNIVVEFGGSQHQALIDRYVAGEEVPYTELRRVWTDAVGWVPTVSHLGFVNVFAQIRATNFALAPDQRIKVWLAAPPIDWANVKSRADLDPAMDSRDSFAADLIRENLLAANKKALVIFGGGHLGRDAAITRNAAVPGGEAAVRKLVRDLTGGVVDTASLSPQLADNLRVEMTQWQAMLADAGPAASVTFAGVEPGDFDAYVLQFERNTQTLLVKLDGQGKLDAVRIRPAGVKRTINLLNDVEAKRPNTFFLVAPYTGYAEAACNAAFEASLAQWPSPSLVTSISETAMWRDAVKPGCSRSGWMDSYTYHAVLFLGRAGELTMSPIIPDLYMDLAYRREISRRNGIMTGQPPTPVRIQDFPVTPKKLRP